MTFTNIKIDVETLPQATALKMQVMPQAYKHETLTQLAIIFVVLFVISWVPWVLPFTPPKVTFAVKFLPLLVVGIAALVTTLAVMQFKFKAYALREQDIAYQSGLIFRKTVLLPFNRVQHMEVTSGPLQRRFGLASLKFFTAGGASVDLKIAGLKAPEAERLRAFILHRSQGDNAA